jgi:hypothetical protein
MLRVAHLPPGGGPPVPCGLLQMGSAPLRRRRRDCDDLRPKHPRGLSSLDRRRRDGGGVRKARTMSPAAILCIECLAELTPTIAGIITAQGSTPLTAPRSSAGLLVACLTSTRRGRSRPVRVGLRVLARALQLAAEVRRRDGYHGARRASSRHGGARAFGPTDHARRSSRSSRVRPPSVAPPSPKRASASSRFWACNMATFSSTVPRAMKR